jgi:hypothetical protein
MAKIEISVEEVREIQKRRSEINSYDLHDITFTFEGKPIELSEEEVADFRYLGLNNIDFFDIILEQKVGGTPRGGFTLFSLYKDNDESEKI